MNINDIPQATSSGKQVKVCPYLGLEEDPQTTLFYPSSVNVCYHAKPLASPNLDHQRSFCLKGREHTQCPVFIQNVIAPLPPEIILPSKRRFFRKRNFLPILLGCFVLILGAIAVFWLVEDIRAHGSISPVKSVSPTPTATAIPLIANTFPFTVTPVTPTIEIVTETGTPQTPTLTFTPTLQTQTLAPCGPPYNWIIYIVRPGDTLSSLSLAYGISISELQKANCMGNSTILHTGQRLYVPARATRVPSATPPGATIPASTNTDTPQPGLPSDTPTEASISPPTDTSFPTDIPTETLVPTIP